MSKPRYRVGLDGSNPRVMDAQGAFRPFGPLGSAASFEAAGYGRRLANFVPSRVHINSAIQAAGRTLVKRARFLVENNGYAGNAVDVWAAWVVGEGIQPLVKVKGHERRKKVRSLWKKWARECDAEGMTNFSGLQEKIAREAYIAGEVFVRRRKRRRGDMMSGIPVQFQILPSEMLDLAFNQDLGDGRYIRMGIEFNAIGRRLAYHFWRQHPDDLVQRLPTTELRSRVPAEDVLHVFDGRQGGQIRGVSKFSRAMVKLFMFDLYDDAELDRKKTAALYAGFVTKEGENSPIDGDEDEDGDVQLEPGAMVVLNGGEKVEWSKPADVGGSYEPFQYRTLLQVGAALGIPYAYLSGDTTKGNFANVRTEIINFRRRVGQHQANVIIPQSCDPMAEWWFEAADLAGEFTLDDDDEVDWLPPKMDWVDPAVDVKADILAVRAGFKSRTRVVAGLGEDREELDDEIQSEMEDADRRGIILDTDPRRTSMAGMSNAMPPGSGYADADDEIQQPSADQPTESAGGAE